MGQVKLEVKCPKSVHGIAVDPQPDWSLDSLITELNVLEIHIKGSLSYPKPLKNTKIRKFSELKENKREKGCFVMRISDDEMTDLDFIESSVTTGTRFSCAEIDLSDSEGSEDEFDHETLKSHLMDKTGQAEGILFESEREHRLRVQEDIWNRLSALEANLRDETERLVSSLNQVDKYVETRREMDRRLDKQYQRKTAEALDSHLSVVQRDHEQLSQIEERRIRIDAAFEEAKRKEKALQEDRVRQEKAKAEAEARLLVARAAEERKAALESERKAREIAEKEASAHHQVVAEGVTQKEASNEKKETHSKEVKEGDGEPKKSGPDESGVIIKAAESALRAEMERLQKHKEVIETNDRLKNSNKDFTSFERLISRLVKQITGSEEMLRTIMNGLTKVINNPLVPQSVFVANFAKQIVARTETATTLGIDVTAFACGRIIVLVSSQVPVVMDLVLAVFHKECIYTVPKHISYSKSAAKTKGASDDGKIESCMIYYASLVQTEINGIKNPHGLQEAWKWLARFLNTIPATRSSAIALSAFLRIAGFMMFRKYKSQFRKILDVISREFLVLLKKKQDPKLNDVLTQLETYIEKNKFLQEPEGWRLQVVSQY